MKTLVLGLSLWAWLAAGAASGADTPQPAEELDRIVRLIAESNRALVAGGRAEALAGYQSAGSALTRLRADHPLWNTGQVTMRWEFVTQQIAGLSASQPPAAGVVQPWPTDLTNAFLSLQRQARAAEAEGAALVARHRAEIAEAERKLEVQSEAAVALLAEATVKLDAQTRRVEQLEAGRLALDAQLEAASRDREELERLRGEVPRLEQDLANLRAQAEAARQEAGRVQALLVEIEGLKLQNAELARKTNAAASPVTAVPTGDTRIADLQRERLTRVEALEAELKTRAEERQQWEQRYEELRQGAVEVSIRLARSEKEAARARELEQQVAGLETSLAAARAESDRKERDATARIRELNSQLGELRSKLQAMEAKPVENALPAVPTPAVEPSRPAAGDSLLGRAVVAAENVNARALPTTHSEAVARFDQGNVVEVLEIVDASRPAEGEPARWAKIAWPVKARAWVRSDYLEPDGRSVRATTLNVRAGPGEKHTIIATLERGAPVTRVDVLGSWVQIEAPADTAAYIAADLLKLPPPAGATPATGAQR